MPRKANRSRSGNASDGCRRNGIRCGGNGNARQSLIGDGSVDSQRNGLAFAGSKYLDDAASRGGVGGAVDAAVLVKNRRLALAVVERENPRIGWRDAGVAQIADDSVVYYLE